MFFVAPKARHDVSLGTRAGAAVDRTPQGHGLRRRSDPVLGHDWEPHFSEYDTSSLQTIGGGGAPAPPKLVASVANSFSSGGPTLGYGMTETNAYGPGNYGEDYLTPPLRPVERPPS